MRIAWCVVALLAGATAWAQAQNLDNKRTMKQTPFGEVTPKLWLEAQKGDKHASRWHMGKMTVPQMLAMGTLPSPLGKGEKASAKPIPTEWPDAKFEQIPTTWPKLKMLLIGSEKKEPNAQ